jgi:hypothetical protein
MQKRINYTQSDLDAAIREVKDGNLTIYRASKQFNVPASTISSNIRGKNKTNRLGATTLFTPEEETELEFCISFCADCGYPLNRQMILFGAHKILKEKKPYANELGRKWLDNFLKRHPSSSILKGHAVSKESSTVSEGNIRNWHMEMTAVFTKYDVLHILQNHPELIFNVDETGFHLVPRTSMLIARRSAANAYKIANGREKVSVTAMYCISAAGVLVPPMMLFKKNNRMLEIAHTMSRKFKYYLI